MTNRNKDHVYQVYDDLIDWFENAPTKDLKMEKSFFYLIMTDDIMRF